MNNNHSCLIYDSVSKIKNVKNKCIVCTNCEVLKMYKDLIESGEIDITEDLTRFNNFSDDSKNKKRGKRNGKSNKCNSKRTVSNGRKVSKYKHKKMEGINV